MNDKTILITGVTGQQGGAVARELAGKGFNLRGMTRKLDSDAAKAIAALGVELVFGDLDDAASLRTALLGAWGVFGVQNTWEAGVEKEEGQGKRLAQVAREAGVEHYVYTSVGSAQRSTGIPHFENKFRVEQELKSLGFASHVILRPAFFMENLLGGWFLQGDKLMMALAPTTRLQMVAVKDIGRVGAAAFLRAQELNRREIDLAGDAPTLPECAAVLSRSLGRQLEFVQLPIEAVRQNSADMAAMLEWFEAVGYNADVPALDKEFGHMQRLEEWAAGVKASVV